MSMNDKKTILLIEEDFQEAKLACNACQKSNGHYEMIHVLNGEEALDYLHCRGIYTSRDREKEPSLILLNLDTPQLKALRTLKEIRTHKKTQSLPIVLLTKNQQDLDVAKAYEYGANSYIKKPRLLDDFVEVINGLTFYWFNLVTLPPIQKCP